jgi:hypothetical protein
LEQELKKVTKKKKVGKGNGGIANQPSFDSVDLEVLTEEMRVLTQKAKKVNFYYHWMTKFETLQMEHTFAKAKLLMH